MGLLQDLLGSLGSSKKKTKKRSSTSSDPMDAVLDNVDEALQGKLPDGQVTDLATDALDQNKDGRIADDLLSMGGKLFKKK